jgi:hypothetical protein
MFIADPGLISFGYKVAASAAVGVIMAIVLWPFRTIKKEWVEMKKNQASIHSELVQQRTNCLTTLQTQGDRQIELLGKVSDTLTGIALSQAEMTGYCKANSGIGCGPRSRRRTKK